jgi:hypothetical protein
MPYEEIEVRVSRDGFIYVDTRGLAPERVRSILDYLTETIGPVREVIDPSEAPPQTINLDESVRADMEESLRGEGSETEEEERRRLKVRQILP